MKTYKSKKRTEASYESIDNLSSLPKALVKDLGKEAKAQLNEGANDLLKQLFGADLRGGSEAANDNNEQPQTQEASPSHESGVKESVIFEMHSQKKERTSSGDQKTEKKAQSQENRQPGIEYYAAIARSSENFSSRETRELKDQIKQIMLEIRKLASSTKELQVEFGQITVEEAPANPGKYYVSFFEWLLIVLRQSRQKVEDSKAWLDTVHTKGKKKSGYWDNAKKQGTTFTQANERNVATSTG